MCRVPARVAPPPVFRVSPQLLEHGIDDVVHASVDESCILVEKFSDRSLDSGFSRTITACFLLTAILNFLLFSIAILPKLLPGKKARLVCRRAGATHASLGRLKGEKVGSLPPHLTFFPRPLSLLLRLYLFADQRISIWRDEECAPKKVKRAISTFFTLRAVQGHIIGQWNLALDDPQAVSLVLARLSPLC
jgi:hypothetical protein